MKNLRNTHLLEAAAHAAASGKSLNMIEIARKIVDGPAPGYYIDHSRAMRFLHLYQRNKLPVNMSRQKRRMWTEIFGRVNKTMCRYPHLTQTRALQRVLCEGQASSFFIEPVTAAKILRKSTELLNYNIKNTTI